MIPPTSTNSATRLRTMMRRVRLEKTCNDTKRDEPSNSLRANANLPGVATPVSINCRSSTPAVTSSSSPSLHYRSDLLEAIADAVQRFDHVEVVVDRLELLAQPLDVAVDGAVVDVDLVVVGSVHQCIPALYNAWAVGKGVED